MVAAVVAEATTVVAVVAEASTVAAAAADTAVAIVTLITENFQSLKEINKVVQTMNHFFYCLFVKKVCQFGLPFCLIVTSL